MACSVYYANWLILSNQLLAKKYGRQTVHEKPKQGSNKSLRSTLGIMTLSMYTRDHLCPELKPGQKCFIVQQYKDGNVFAIFHEHVPSHRISQKSEHAVLHDLALYYGKYSAISILHSRLNNRRGDPTRFPTFHHHVSHPEEGVIRHSIVGISVSVWFDSIIDLKQFRQQCSEK